MCSSASSHAPSISTRFRHFTHIHPYQHVTKTNADAKTNHFVRLLQLWETGGLYLDSFTTLLTQPFPAGHRFWSFGQKCVADRDAGANAEWAYTGSQEHYVLAAPTAEDSVLGCVLRRFDDPKDVLHACMAAADGGDGNGAGAACVHKALDECAATVKGGAPTLVRGVDALMMMHCQPCRSRGRPTRCVVHSTLSPSNRRRTLCCGWAARGAGGRNPCCTWTMRTGRTRNWRPRLGGRRRAR